MENRSTSSVDTGNASVAPATYTCKCKRVSVATLSRVPRQFPPLIRDPKRGVLCCRCGIRVPWSVKVKLKVKLQANQP